MDLEERDLRSKAASSENYMAWSAEESSCAESATAGNNVAKSGLIKDSVLSTL